MNLAPIVFALLLGGSLLTGAVSAMAGMAGGILLLSLMSLFLPFGILIPVHGIVQLVSNSSRAYLLKHEIALHLVWPFFIGAPLGAVLSTYFIGKVDDPSLILTAIAVFILYAVFGSKRLPSLKVPTSGFLIVGFLAGGLGMIVGATGPILAPFMLRDDLNKREIVATKASLQFSVHILKIPAFLYLGFNYREYALLIIGMSLCTLIGTRVGISILSKLPEKVFRRIFTTLLLVAAVRLLWKAWIVGL